MIKFRKRKREKKGTIVILSVIVKVKFILTRDFFYSSFHLPLSCLCSRVYLGTFSILIRFDYIHNYSSPSLLSLIPRTLIIFFCNRPCSYTESVSYTLPRHDINVICGIDKSYILLNPVIVHLQSRCNTIQVSYLNDLFTYLSFIHLLRMNVTMVSKNNNDSIDQNQEKSIFLMTL